MMLRTVRIAPRSLPLSPPRRYATTLAAEKRPFYAGWRSQLDNTLQFVLWAAFGSAAMHLIEVKSQFAEATRVHDTRIAVLQDLIDRVGRGEEVDVARELRVGEREGELEWECIVQGIEQRLDRRRRSIRQALGTKQDDGAEREEGGEQVRSWWQKLVWS